MSLHSLIMGISGMPESIQEKREDVSALLYIIPSPTAYFESQLPYFRKLPI